MKTYSYDLRERVVRACDEGTLTRPEIADRFGVSTSWIRRLLQRRRETGSFAAKPHGGGRKPKLGPAQRQQLFETITERPDTTLEELRRRIGAFVHVTTLYRLLAAFGLTFKKKCCTRRSATAPTCATSVPVGGAG
jgi:transposase